MCVCCVKEKINPFAPGDFAEKGVLKLYHQAIYKSYTLQPPDPGARYQLGKFGHVQKANFEIIVFGFKSDTAVLTFTFRFLSSPLFSLFLPHFFSRLGI